MNEGLGPAGTTPCGGARHALLSQPRLERSALYRWMAEHPQRPLHITLPAPQLLAERLLDHDQVSVFWSHGGQSCVGFGVAAELSAEGPERFEHVQQRAPLLLADHFDARLGTVMAAPHPRLFGGFAFAAGGQRERAKPQPWGAFGDARFVLPRLCYWSARGEPSRLSLFIGSGERDRSAALLERVDALLAWMQRLTDEPVAPPSAEAASPEQQERGDAEQWRALVDSILDGIGAQRWSKVVAARRRQMTFAEPISLARTMRVLADSHPGSTRFAFRFEQTIFAGATPERLLSKRGLKLRTEALAGTFGSESASLAAELLQRPKERDEHAPVLRAIISALQPHCRSIEHAPRPVLRSLKHVLHLCTPIEAELSAPRHVLELISHMHPTPAVGGVPTPSAVRWILEHEPFDRGWYCGPIGWFDAEGDGDFDVALRSGVIRGKQVQLFAGAGIVQGSEPLAEYEETELKLRALRSALRT